MKILVLNCGSSSIKYKLYNMDDNSVLAAGGVERIGLDEAFIKITLPNGEKKKIMHDMPDHKEGVNFVFQCLLDPEFGAIKSLSEIDAVGHRIVQGGDLFEKSVIVDKSVEDGIESLCDLAPVHNAGHLKGLRAVDKLMPEVPQVCVFDNAFHSTMPDYAYLYAVPSSSTRSITCVATASTAPATATYRSACASSWVATSRHSASSPATSATVHRCQPLSSASASIPQWVSLRSLA